jgi:hypothetical protein
MESDESVSFLAKWRHFATTDSREGSYMRNNPFPDEPTDVIPPMADLQPRVVPSQLPQTPQDQAIIEEQQKVIERQEEDRTIKFVIGKVRDYIQWIAIVIEVLLLIEFVFRLIGASPYNIFAAILYGLTENVILLPFNNLVYNPPLCSQLSTCVRYFEWTTLIAMAIYALIFWLIRSFVRLLVSSPEEPVE